VQVALLQQLAQDHAGAADVVHVARQVFATGLEVGDQRGAREHGGHVVEVEGWMPASCAMAGMCSAALVEPPVAETTAQAFSSAWRVTMSRGSGASPMTAAIKRLARFAQQRRALAEHGRHHAGADRRQAQRLADHAHGVGGELARAGARRGQAGARHGVEFIQRRVAGEHPADGLVGVDHVEVGTVRPRALAGQGRAAVHEHAGHIAAHHAHHQAGQVFVAGAHAEDAVPLVAAHRGLHTVGNQLAGDQREAHARVRHGQPVAHRHHRAFVRRAAGGVDAGLGVLGLLAQVQVAGAHLAAGVEHADVGTGDVFVVLPQRVQEAAGAGAQRAIVDRGRTETAGLGGAGHAGVRAGGRWVSTRCPWTPVQQSRHA
jgi:hypothetical protein